MTKIKELMDSVIVDSPVYPEQYFSIENIEKIMKEYAEVYARRVLEIAAENATANFECIGAVLGAENVNPYVEPGSILNIKLPEHI